MGGYALVSQLAVYHGDQRSWTAASIRCVLHRKRGAHGSASRPPVMGRSLDLFYRDRFPGIEILLREAGPRDPLSRKAPRFRAARRMAAHQRRAGARRKILSVELRQDRERRRHRDGAADRRVPGGPGSAAGPGGCRRPNLGPGIAAQEAGDITTGAPLPPSRSRFNRLDPEVVWFAHLPADDWKHPGKIGRGSVHRREVALSAVFWGRCSTART